MADKTNKNKSIPNNRSIIEELKNFIAIEFEKMDEHVTDIDNSINRLDIKIEKNHKELKQKIEETDIKAGEALDLAKSNAAIMSDHLADIEDLENRLTKQESTINKLEEEIVDSIIY